MAHCPVHKACIAQAAGRTCFSVYCRATRGTAWDTVMMLRLTNSTVLRRVWMEGCNSTYSCARCTRARKDIRHKICILSVRKDRGA